MLLQSVHGADSAHLFGQCTSHAALNWTPRSCSVQCMKEHVGGGILQRKTAAVGRLKKSPDKQFEWWKGEISPAVGTGQTPRRNCWKRQKKELMY